MTPTPYECASCGPNGYTRLRARARESGGTKQVVECTACGRSWQVR